MRQRNVLWSAAFGLFLGGAMVAPAGSSTANPGHDPDGQIVYGLYDPSIDDTAAFTINPDGTHAREVALVAMECPHWSPDGTLLASCGAPDPNATTMVNVDTGEVRYLPSVAAGLFAGCFVWSPDGQRLACEGLNDDDPSLNGLFTVRFSDWSDARRLTTIPGGDDIPGDYSPNSRQLVFSRDFGEADANPALFRINANGTGMQRLTPPNLIIGSSGSWSTQGNEILFSARNDSEHRQMLWLVHSDGSGLHPLIVDGIPCGGSFDDPDSVGCTNPMWSPSGRQMVFRANSATGSIVERADADGSDVTMVVDLGFDGGDFVDWGTHPLATTP